MMQIQDQTPNRAKALALLCIIIISSSGLLHEEGPLVPS